MNMRLIVMNIALMVVFGVGGLTLFTENVRIAQIIGLFASGTVFGASFTTIISAVRSKQKKA